MENLMLCLLIWELTGTGQGLCFSIPTVAVGPVQHGVVYSTHSKYIFHFTAILNKSWLKREVQGNENNCFISHRQNAKTCHYEQLPKGLQENFLRAL
jgi:hypothetical protein